MLILKILALVVVAAGLGTISMLPSRTPPAKTETPVTTPTSSSSLLDWWREYRNKTVGKEPAPPRPPTDVGKKGTEKPTTPPVDTEKKDEPDRAPRKIEMRCPFPNTCSGKIPRTTVGEGDADLPYCTRFDFRVLKGVMTFTDENGKTVDIEQGQTKVDWPPGYTRTVKVRAKTGTGTAVIVGVFHP